MSIGLRTLPLHVEPLCGESGSSWLIALAGRHHASVHDLMLSSGLDTHGRRHLRYVDDTMAGEFIDFLASVTAVGPGSIRKLSANGYFPLPPRNSGSPWSDPAYEQVRRRFWRVSRSYNYCPRCLAENGGRWLQRWRLVDTFACTQHQCLLRHTCPHCNSLVELQRLQTSRLSGFCCRKWESTAKSKVCCGLDLSECGIWELSEDHPVLAAQAYVNALIDKILSGPLELAEANVGIFTRTYTDFRYIARFASMYASRNQLISDNVWSVIPDGLEAIVAEPRDSRHGSHMPPALAASAAVLATEIVTADSGCAADRLGSLLSEAVGAPLSLPTQVELHLGYESNRLERLLLQARREEIRPIKRLRYGVYGSSPSRPRDSENLAETARYVPPALWPDWSLLLVPSGLSIATARAAISVAILIVGRSASVGEAKEMLSIGQEHVLPLSSIVGGLEDDGILCDALTAITRIAEYIDENGGMIDYSWRARLNPACILTAAGWRRCCDQGNCDPGRGYKLETARQFLYNRVSGRADRGTNFLRYPMQRFIHDLTPELLIALDAEASQFIATAGVCEPTVWSPPLHLAADLRIQPWVPPKDEHLSSLLHLDRRSITDAAAALEIAPGRLALYLHDHPAPAARKPLSNQPMTRRSRNVDRKLSAKRIDEYMAAGYSTREIALATGLGYTTVRTRLLALDAQPHQR